MLVAGQESLRLSRLHLLRMTMGLADQPYKDALSLFGASNPNGH